MKHYIGTDLHILNRNELSGGTQILYINELSPPPPYSQQAIGSDWKHEIIEIEPLNDNLNKYGFVITGGIDTRDGSSIVITHIDHCSKSSLDNGRTKLRLFDRIFSLNDINLINVTHDEAVRAFSSSQGQSIKLHICRLNPLHIEHIDFILPSDMSNQSLGITIRGGSDNNIEDPGLFIIDINPNGLLANSQIRIGDRLLEIKTNHTSANLQYVTHSIGIQLIRRICQDNKRVTLIVSHRTVQ
jgi:C-terminal processing protease CtpA/Prc